MILKTLSPLSFGRFQNRELPLSPGVNLIEAPNEAGKSTLAAFISGMLYGFFRRDVKKRLYAPAFERYLPWDNPGRYFGALTILHEGAEYRLERNFLKDEVKLYDAATGRDETGRMPYNAALRIYEPGQFFLGVSQTAFEGTLYVPQQAVRTGDDLGQELRDRIDALSEAGAGTLSASGAIKWLNERRDAIGTPRKGSSPLGEQYRKLLELNEEHAESERKRANAAADARRERELKQEIDLLEKAQREGEKALEQAARHARWKRAEAAKAHHARVSELEETLRTLPEGRADDEIAIENAMQDARQAAELNRQASEAGRALSDLEERIRLARARAEESGLDAEKSALSGPLERADMRLTFLERDLNEKREAELAVRRALPPSPAVTPQRALELMARVEALPAAKPAHMFLILGVVFAVLALLGILFPWAFLCAVPAAGLMAFGMARNQANRKAETGRADILKELHADSPQDFSAIRAALEARARAERALEAAAEATASVKALVDEAKRALSELLEKAGAASQEDFREALKAYEAALEAARALEIRRSAILEQRNTALDQAEALSRSVLEAFSNAGLEEPNDPSVAHEALGAHLKRLRARRETARALEDAQRLLAQCLNGDEYVELVRDASPVPEPVRPQEAIAAEVEARASRIRALSQEMVACAARRDAIEDSCRTASEISGEMALVQEKIDRLTREAEAIDEAKARIERASDEMRKKVSPALGRAIAEVAGHVTLGRYSQLRIDTDLKMQAISDGQTVSPERLSGGTADAIHLALRLGLIEFLMGDRECPVILDDSFAQLDDGRAQRMLETIAEFSKNRQALILTCQSRTRRMLEEMQIAHNPVQL